MASEAKSLGNRAERGWLLRMKRVTSRRVYPCRSALQAPIGPLTLRPSKPTQLEELAIRQ